MGEQFVEIIRTDDDENVVKAKVPARTLAHYEARGWKTPEIVEAAPADVVVEPAPQDPALPQLVDPVAVGDVKPPTGDDTAQSAVEAPAVVDPSNPQTSGETPDSGDGAANATASGTADSSPRNAGRAGRGR